MVVKNWTEFWGGSHSIYVNETHLRAHYARIAADMCAVIGAASRWRILDYGCGDALSAPVLVESTGAEILLYDAVPAVHQRLAARFAAAPGIVVLDDEAWSGLEAASLDAIVMISVAQYMPRGDLVRLLHRFRDLLRPEGMLILGDVIPPDAGMLADVRALLVPAARHGFLVPALIGLARTFLSDYRRLRRTLGLACYTSEDMVQMLNEAGFSARRLPRNIGFNQARMSFRAVTR